MKKRDRYIVQSHLCDDRSSLLASNLLRWCGFGFPLSGNEGRDTGKGGSAQVGSVSTLCSGSGNSESTASSRSGADGGGSVGRSDSLGRRLGLAGGDLDATRLVLYVDCLRVGKSRVFERVQITEVTGLLGEDGSLNDPVHEERVVFAEEEPLKIVRHFW